MRSTRLIAITGGIGTGKSVVSRLLGTMGYPVYDTDAAAKRLMTEDSTLHKELCEAFGNDIYLSTGELNRKGLARLVFADPDALQLLNGIVHPAVINDVQDWCKRCDSCSAFVETAILYQSHLDRIVDAVWQVTAPLQVRVERVMARNGVSSQEVMQRIAAQTVEERQYRDHSVIVNDGITPILPQVQKLLQLLK